MSHRPVVITGPPRVGKSIAADRVARALGFIVMAADELRLSFWGLADRDERQAKRRSVYDDAIYGSDGKVVVEGWDLMLHDMLEKSLRFELGAFDGGRVDLRHAVDLRTRFGAHVFAFGAALDDAGTRIAAMRRHAQNGYSWIAGLSDAEILPIAEQSRTMSLSLRDAARTADVPYFECRSASFENDMDRAVAAILATA